MLKASRRTFLNAGVRRGSLKCCPAMDMTMKTQAKATQNGHAVKVTSNLLVKMENGPINARNVLLVRKVLSVMVARETRRVLA